MRKILFSGLALLLSAGLVAAEVDTKPVTVPFDMIQSGHMSIQIKVNGKGPYRVIFDTGSPVVLLSNRIGTDTGLIKKGGSGSPLDMLFGNVGLAQVKSLEVGSVKAERVPVIIMDHPTVKLMGQMLNLKIDGIVGFPFFGRFKTTVDYQAKQLTFVPNGYEPADLLKEMESLMLKGFMKDKPTLKILSPAAQWGFAVSKEDRDEEPGVVIKEVMPGTPAARAGLEVGDRLLTLNHSWTDSVKECYHVAGRIKAGSEARLMVLRKGKEVEITVKPVAGL